MKQIKFFIVMMMVMLGTLTVNAKKESVNVVAYNSATQERLTLCTAEYFIEGNKLYTNKEFSYLGIIFTKSDGSYSREKSVIFKPARNGYWYVELNNIAVNSNEIVSAIVLCNCKTGMTSNNHQCYDGYIYNNTTFIPAWRGSNTMNTTIQQIINLIKK